VIAFDEMQGSDGAVRPAYTALDAWLKNLPPDLLARESNRIPVRRRDEILLVPVRDIASVVAEGELLHIRTGQGDKHTISYRLRDLESRIASSRYIRLGRGTIVNLDMINRIIPLPGGTYTVKLTNGQEFKVSRIQSRIIRDQLLRL